MKCQALQVYSVLGWVSPKTVPDTGSWVPIVYFGGDPRKHLWGVGKWVREWEKGSKECIIKQIIAVGHSNSVLLANSWERAENVIQNCPKQGDRKLKCLNIKVHPSLVEGCSPGGTHFSNIWGLPSARAKPTPAAKKYSQAENDRCLQQDVTECKGAECWQGMDRAQTRSTQRHCEFSSRQRFAISRNVAISRNRFASNEFSLSTSGKGQKQSCSKTISNRLQLFDEGTWSGSEFLHDPFPNSGKQTRDSEMGDTTEPRRFYNFIPPSKPYPTSTISKVHGFSVGATTVMGVTLLALGSTISEDALKQGRFCRDANI